MTGKQKRILSITLASWGVIMVGSGMAMNASIHPIIKTSYSTAVNHIKVNESKTNEIILKQITIEINNPLSVDVKDYLENVEQLDNNTLKALKLDTSMVKINEAGIYTYTITLKKKKYNGTITVYNPVPKTPIPTKHTCEVVDGRYYDKEGNTVSELEYNNSCQPTASQSPSPSPSPSPSEENKNLFPVLP